jgi:hypothetical protein
MGNSLLFFDKLLAEIVRADALGSIILANWISHTGNLDTK